MALLKSVDNNPDINFIEYRDQDYYGKHRYRARVTIPGIRRMYFSKTFRDFTVRLNGGQTPSWRNVPKKEVIEIAPHLADLEKLYDWTATQKKAKSVTIRSESNTMAIFSNDLSLLHTLRNVTSLVDFTEAETGQFVGIKNFVNEPKHKYRIYLRSKVVESSFRTDFIQFLKTQPKLYPSSSLKSWLSSSNQWSWSHRYTSSSHFIDYDDESTLSYLMLMYGGIFGKRYKLEKRPTTV